MRMAAGPPTRWLVTLQDGSVVAVWADTVTGLSGPEDDRDYDFGCLMDIDPEVQDEFDVIARTPANPSRVEVLVARFPRGAVADITSV